MAALRELRLVGTTIILAEGAPLGFASEALYAAVNARGVLASGFGGAIRLAGGGEVERELRAQAPLLVGEAYLTGPGNLDARGVARIAFGVTVAEPGGLRTRKGSEDALTHGLEQLELAGTRALTLPEIGSRIPGLTIDEAASIPADAVYRRIRLGTSLERVTIAGLHLDYLRRCRDRLMEHGATTE